MPAVVKRRGGKEDFDERKVYTSIFMACRAVEKYSQERCEEIASSIASGIAEKVKDNQEVLSVEIRMWGRNALKEIDETLADTFYRYHIDMKGGD